MESKHQTDCFLPYISKEKQEKLKRFYFIEDFHRGLFSDVLIRALIKQQLGINNNEISFGENEYGKPYLKNSNDFHFNLSHSGNWVVCAISDNPIGIDVEEIKTIDLAIAKNFFSRNEHKDLFGLDEDKRIDYFYSLWSLKESYIKALGKGLSIPLDSFSINALNGEITLLLHDPGLHKAFFKLYDIDIDYKLAICSNSKNNLPDSVQLIDQKQILSILQN